MSTIESNIIGDLSELFEAFKGHPDDQNIDTSTLYFFLNQQRLLVLEPEFCFFIYNKFKNTKQISKHEYELAFRDFK